MADSNLNVNIIGDSSKLRAELRLAQQELKNLAAAEQAAVKAGNVAEVNKASAAYETQRRAVAALGAEYKNLTKSTSEGRSGINSLTKSLTEMAEGFENIKGMFKAGAAAFGIGEAFAKINELMKETSQRLTDIQKAAQASGLKPVAVQAFTEIMKETNADAGSAASVLTRFADAIGKARIAAGSTTEFEKGIKVMRGMGDAASNVQGSLSDAARSVQVFRGGIKNVIDIGDPFKSLKIDVKQFADTSEGTVALWHQVAKSLIELQKNKPSEADAVGVALFGKKFAELAGTLKEISEGKFDEKIKAVAGSARAATPEIIAMNNEIQKSADEAEQSWQNLSTRIFMVLGPLQIAISNLKKSLAEGSMAAPGSIGDPSIAAMPFDQATLDKAKDTFGAGLVAYIKQSWSDLGAFFTQLGSDITAIWDDVWKSLTSGVDATVNWIVDKFRGLASTISSIVSSISSTASAIGSGDTSGAPFAAGGMVRGPGGDTSDSIMARLSNGEFVMRAAAVRHWGADMMAALNAAGSNVLPRSASRRGFAAGGMVTATTGDGVTVNLHFPGGNFALHGDKAIVAGLTREARRAGMLSARRLEALA